LELILIPEWRLPGDKSLTHRALIFSACASGTSIIEGFLSSEDCTQTRKCLEHLGVQFTIEPGRMKVVSPGFHNWESPKKPLYFGNSGTTARLLMGILSSHPRCFITAYGDSGLSIRPMARVSKPLSRMGANFLLRDDKWLPLAIKGSQLRPLSHELKTASAQIKSAILLATIFSHGLTSIQMPVGSRNHTENILYYFKGNLERQIIDNREIIRFRGPLAIAPTTYRIPVDPSSVAFFVAWSLITKRVICLKDVLLNPTRIGFIGVLQRMGARISIKKNVDQFKGFSEDQGDLLISETSCLHHTEVSKEDIPTLIDEVMILALVASFASGTTVFHGIEELSVKESNRLEKTIELITKIGGTAKTEGSSLQITGGLKNIQPFSYTPNGDHRMAMVAAIAEKCCQQPCEIFDKQCVNVSFPGFFDYLDRL